MMFVFCVAGEWEGLFGANLKQAECQHGRGVTRLPWCVSNLTLADTQPVVLHQCSSKQFLCQHIEP